MIDVIFYWEILVELELFKAECSAIEREESSLYNGYKLIVLVLAVLVEGGNWNKDLA